MSNPSTNVQRLTPEEARLRFSVAVNLCYIATLYGSDRNLHVYHTYGCEVTDQDISKAEFACGQGYVCDRSFQGEGDDLGSHATIVLWTNPQTGKAGYDHIAL